MLRSYGLECKRVVLAVDMEREADMQKLFKTVIAPIEQRLHCPTTPKAYHLYQ